MPATAFDVTKFLGNLIQLTSPGTTMWVTGARQVTDEEEWICYRLLAHTPMVSRKIQAKDHFYIEVACYSKHGKFRTDHRINRPWELGQTYYNLLHQKDYIVESSCLRFLEGRLIYQDLSAMGNQIANISLQSPQLNMHSVHLEIEAMLLEQR